MFTSDSSETNRHEMSVQHASLAYNSGSVSKQPTRWLHAIEAKQFFSIDPLQQGRQRM